MVAKVRNAGQTCICPNRVYVQEGVHDEFVRKLGEQVRALRVGPANREESEIGPLINKRAVDKVEQHVQDALQKGASVAVGGAPPVPGSAEWPLLYTNRSDRRDTRDEDVM